MKRAPLKNLVYREFYMIKRNALLVTVAFVGLAIICILVQLSMEIGNLSKLSVNDMKMIKDIVEIYINYIPIGAAGMIFGVVCEGVVKEVTPIWHRFFLSTPVSEWRFALAKYITIIIMFCLSFLLSLFYTGIIFTVKNEKITMTDISIAIVLLLGILLFEQVMQVLTLLFCSAEKALLAAVGIAFVVIGAGYFKRGINLETAMEENAVISLKSIEEWCVSVLPYTPIILIITILFGFVTTALLYKRRER